MLRFDVLRLSSSSDQLRIKLITNEDGSSPLFSIPTHQFLFNGGNINARDYIDALQLEESEFDLIKYPERGTCLFKCGNERYLLQVKAPEYKAKLFGDAGGR